MAPVVAYSPTPPALAGQLRELAREDRAFSGEVRRALVAQVNAHSKRLHKGRDSPA